MRQKVVTVSDKSRTSYEKCRKTKGKSTWAQNVHSNKLHVQKACTHTHTQTDRGDTAGSVQWPATTRRDAKAKAKGGQDVMTIKTNANCKLLAKCSRLSPPSPPVAALQQGRRAQPTRWRQRQLVVSFCSHFLCMAINYGPAGRHWQRTTTSLEQHTHTCSTHTRSAVGTASRREPTHFYYCI